MKTQPACPNQDSIETPLFLLKRTCASLLLAWLLAAGCTTIDHVTGENVQNMYSLDDEIQMGTEVVRGYTAVMISNNVPVNQDLQRLAHLQDMMRRITTVSHIPTLPYEVTLYHADIVNAMAAPGGKIMVFEGLWNGENGLVRDDDELAAVMAHEIAHVNCRHSTEAMTRALPAQLLLATAALYAEMEEDEDVATAVSAAFLLYQGLWIPYYSRRDELEADRVGMMYMAKAGYDPEAAIRIWKRVDEHEGSIPVLSIFSTHPTHQKRHEELMQYLPAARTAYNQTRPNL